MKFKRYKNAYTPLTHYISVGSFKDNSFRQIKMTALGDSQYWITSTNGYSNKYHRTVKGFKEAKQYAIDLIKGI